MQPTLKKNVLSRDSSLGEAALAGAPATATGCGEAGGGIVGAGDGGDAIAVA